MSKVGLVIEFGKHMGIKASGIAAAFAVEALADPALGPSLAFTQKMREIGQYPLDVFNHTGNFMVAAIGGFATSFMAAGAQKLVSDIRGTAETVSLCRMNRVAMAAGLLGAAAASYALEKLGGSIDMFDIAYSMGAGALGASMFRLDREPVYDSNWRPPELPQAGPETPGLQPPEPPRTPDS